MALPNYLYIVYPIYGHFGFWSGPDWRVEYSNRKPLKVGDVIDWRALPFSQRYDTGEFGRMARTGTVVAFPVIRDGVRLRIPLRSEYRKERFGGGGEWWLYALKKSAEFFIVLLTSALVLIRPTRLSWLFFLYAIALAADEGFFWSFLPAPAFTAMSLFAGILALSAPPSMLTLFALELPSTRSDTRWRSLQRIIPYLFAIFSALVVALIVREHFAIRPGAWVPNVTIAFGAFMWILSVGILLSDMTDARRQRARALSWACAALAGAALCYAYIYVAALIAPAFNSYPNHWGLVSLLLSLAAMLAIVRGRIIELRFVITRAALSAGIGFFIVGTFALVNLAFAAQIAHFAYVVPIEIVVAVLLGFRLGGLQDVSAALNLANVDAADARMQGNRVLERESLTRALARAERTRNPRLVAMVRAHAAFGSWLAGDDEEFEHQMTALESLACAKTMRGVQRFLTCRNGAPVPDPPERGEPPEWTAKTEIVACGETADAVQAKRHATLAFGAAQASADVLLQVLAGVALAEFDSTQRERLYEQAQERCGIAGANVLKTSVQAVAMGKQHLGMLDAFINKHLRAQRTQRPTLEICFADTTVKAWGVPIELRPRELALLLLVAETPRGASFDELSDRLWPDLDGDAARNVLRVTLHRLRKSLGDDAAIARNGSRYRLRDGVVVDIWSLRKLLDTIDRSASLPPQQRVQLDAALEMLRNGRRTRPGQEWFFPIEQTIEQITNEIAGVLDRDAGTVASTMLGRGSTSSP
jgi:hypothetical protein